MDIANLKRQHSEIMNQAKYILDNIENASVQQNIQEIVQTMNAMAGKLRIHLMNEDEYLYPPLLNHPDESLQAFAKTYISEMMEVTKAYSDYKSKYNTASKIENNLEGFIQETKQVFAVLANRVEREENELYPLLG
ncbi:Haemerythrin/HHE cation-binding motif [Syntrophomonas zehnderi OL-4]|uniref:Haemerythrin/HHE cation-binding motif n=1 Tax=Syntrophomonas zehnderi OL-4 TaxID=690567 RepID=A0A0E4GC94_9FIRM|nr:hemerythrin domain-containing protein [Syntrophomonas zehnderi]CFY07522.1 Haemerythrin/HHE cation-binding motif [Syntrophomonas zehnderi OL-4]